MSGPPPATPAIENRPAKLDRRQIFTLAAITALGPLALDMYLPAATTMARDLGAATGAATYSVSIFLIGMAAGQLIAGPLSDRLGRRPMILAGLAIFAAASVLAALTDSYTVLLGARLLQALGACAALNSSRAVVRDRLGHGAAARIFSQMALVSGLAPVLGPLFGAWLAHAANWRMNFHVMGLLAAIMLLAAWAALPESRSDATAAQAQTEHPIAAYRHLLANPALRGYLLAAVCNSAAFFTYIANSPAIFTEVYSLTPAQYSLLFAANSIALVSASQINRHLLRRRSLNDVLRISGRNALLLATGYVLLAVSGTTSLPLFALLLFLTVGSAAPVQANTLAGGLSADGLRAGSAAALFGMSTFAAGAVASWIGGLIHDGTARPLCFLIAALLAAGHLAIRRLVRAGSEAP